MELSQEQLNELKELLKPKATEQPQATPQSQEFQIRVGDQNYIVRSQEEAQRLFDQYEAQQNQALEAERVKALALEQRQQQYAQTPQRQAATDGFDKEEYARLFLDDPRKANRYAMQHDQEQIQFYQGLVSQISAMKQESAAQQFIIKHRDDYVATDKNFKAINDVIAQYNLPWNLQGMDLAFQVARASGNLDLPEAQQKQLEQAQHQTLGQEDGEPAFTPAPRLRRRAGGVDEGDIAERFEKLSSDEQKKYLESLTRAR